MREQVLRIPDTVVKYLPYLLTLSDSSCRIVSPEGVQDMPDLDIIDRIASPGWRGVTRMYAGGAASANEMRSPTLKALAKSLRDGGGLPGFSEFGAIVQRVCTGDLSALEAMREVRSLVREYNGHLHTKVAAEAVSTLIVEVVQGSTTITEPALTVAEQFCSALVDYHLFSRARPYLVGQRFADHGAAFQEENACKAARASDMHKVAEGLARDPTGKSLRAPSVQRSHRRSTASLLNEPIG